MNSDCADGEIAILMQERPVKVLVIDDEEGDYVAAHELLSESPTTEFAVDWAGTFEEGLEEIARQAHDVYLVGYRLGRRTGVELLRQAVSSGCKAPIIMLTSPGDAAVDLTAMQAGAADHLVKGLLDPALLERSIRYAMERKKSERALQEINSELESFAYSVSHDLRAPLRAMQGFSRLLLEDHLEQLDPTGQDYLGRIVAASARLDAMIQNLLDYSRLGRKDLKIHPVPLSAVVTEALAQLEAFVHERRAQIDVVEPLAYVLGNRATLVQILSNLVSNGVKFVEPGRAPKVRIYSETAPRSVRLSIEDNGIGIPSKFHERIFRIFERLHGDEAYRGTGIGLAIVKKGVERMGGRVGVESVPGAGSRFYLDLPPVEQS